ncbi:MAG: PE family protein [Mycobacterium sp.]
MSYVMAAPEMMAAAATDVAAVGATLSVAHMAAVAPTVAVIPAAADEVSASIAHLFSRYAQDYQALAGQVAAFHEEFVRQLNASARSYAATEAASAASLQYLNASLSSFGSAIAALPGQLFNMLTGFWTALFDVAFLALVVGLLALVFGFWILVLAIVAALLGIPLELFGVLI